MDEKIYTSDSASNFSNGAMMGAMLGKDNDNALAFANGGLNNWMNNPFAYLMFMMIPAIWGGNGFNGNNNAVNAQLQSLQTQISDNHNNDLTMQAINGNHAAITQLAQTLNVGFDQVQAAVNQLGQLMQGGMNNVNTSILSQGYQNQLNNCNQTNTILMQSQALQNTIQNGVTALGYQSERNSSATQQASTANTQRIIDTLNNHWNLEQQTTIQQLRDEIGRLNQTNTLISSLKGTATATSTAA